MAKSKRSLAWETDHRRYDFLRIWQKRYAHMLARAEGRATNRSNSNGKGIMSAEAFYEWCRDFDNFSVFLTIYFDWARNGFNRWDSPSIDRIKSDKGYFASNIQWLPFSENCEKNNKDPITHQEMRS